MVTRTDSTGSPRGAPFNLGEGRADALANLQRELLEAYEQAGRAWLARVQSELELWSQLAAKIADDALSSGSDAGLSGIYDTADANGR